MSIHNQSIIFQPRTPSIDELLIQACGGTNDLQTITKISLKIQSNMICIRRLNEFLPKLVALDLDGSSLDSLRDLGSDLKVKFLNVSRCGLISLDGLNGFTSVCHLIADGNKITSVSQLCNLPDLQKLSLRRNRLKDIGTVSFMGLCSELRDIDISENPVCNIKNYRDSIKKSIPNLMILNDIPFIVLDEEINQQKLSFSSSEYYSSSSSTTTTTTTASNSSSGNSISGLNDVQKKTTLPNFELTDVRPSTSTGTGGGGHYDNDIADNSVNDKQKRPSTADPYRPSRINQNHQNLLTSGAPVVGNIISALRRQRNNNVGKKKDKRIAWSSSGGVSLESTSSSSPSSLSSSSSAASSSMNNSGPTEMLLTKIQEFPKLIPQQSIVELELGIIGGIISPSTNNDELTQLTNNSLENNMASGESTLFSTDDKSTYKLLRAARKWRQKCYHNTHQETSEHL